MCAVSYFSSTCITFALALERNNARTIRHEGNYLVDGMETHATRVCSFQKFQHFFKKVLIFIKSLVQYSNDEHHNHR
jgi:hypothetical protein